MATAATSQAYTQDNRLIGVDTPLGKDKLLLTSFAGTEGVSQLFRFQLELIATDAAIPGADLIGKPATVRVSDFFGKTKRFFHGLISHFSQGETDDHFTHYRAEVVPWLWQLTHTADCRTFQRQSVPDIIKKVFQELGFLPTTHYKEALQGSYTKWDYCIQYRESDFNFLSRLMEQEGIFYYFVHEAGPPAKHVLVLADHLAGIPACPGQESVRYLPTGSTHQGGQGEDVIRSWQGSHALRPGKYVLRDYHFEKPQATLEVTGEGKAATANKKWEVFTYPGGYAPRFNGPGADIGKVQDEGRQLVKRRMEEEEATHHVIHGASECRAFSPGWKFKLQGPVGAGDYALLSVQHGAGQSPGYRSDMGEGGYSNTFTCLPINIPFRPPRVTPKPVAYGLQNAVVVGAAGKEIEVDKWGRVKVQFPWDRLGKKDLDSSCWVRVAQVAAGKRWGAYFWPRIGQEVLVAFLEGDPDQPIIVGSVYNADQPPPYLGDGFDPKHPHDPNLSGFKTNSTLGGKGFNELRFNDTQGKEQIFIHGQRDLDLRVKKDMRELVENDAHAQVKGNRNVKVEKDESLTVTGARKEKVGKSYSLEVVKDRMEKVGGGQSLTVTGDQNEKVQNHALEAGMAIHLKAGMTLVLEAGTQLTLKVGGNFIDISPAGVAITGTMVMINSGGSPGSGSGSSPQSPEPPTDPQEADDSKSGSKSAPG
jgi:type VI secretion system secreted protein VgrG